MHANCTSLWPRQHHETITGAHVYLTPLEERHAEGLFQHVGGKDNTSLWTYMADGPFDTIEEFRSYIKRCVNSPDVCFWAIVSRTFDQVLGYASFLRIDQSNGVAEIGNIMYAPVFQRTTGTTEAWFLLADRVFVAGFRRLEWKCNALNRPSMRAAERLGHTFEGVFRQHMIVKGSNRDTAWYSIIDCEWGRLKDAIETWMQGSNFDAAGKQKMDLVAIRNRLQ